MSVRMVDVVEARLVVELECKRKLERCFFVLSSFSLVEKDEVERIDRRFARLRSIPSSGFSFSSSLDEDEWDDSGMGGPAVAPKIEDSRGEEADEIKVASES